MTSPKLLLITATLAVAALAGCSSGDAGMPGMGDAPAASSTAAGAPDAGSATPATGAHSDADVAFAAGMIPHHQQAVAMSDLLLAKTGVAPDVTALATRIRSAQTPEIAQMRGWLVGWGENPSPSPMGGMGGMDHGDGMMTQPEMDALGQATGEDATKRYLTGMVKHHQGAVAMAQTELADGQNADAKKLAQQIVTTQQSEITEMNQLLGG